ncbi:hypothetical protein DSO57_1006528 [Entomophthora muscae]|uniref:Uncharacterized protein n=1 Tax=Entomophthora muscae TaxID=34485 RepID=A0ACC2S9S5_9FUNG|nr:hypothetical protein DSO57_1006528 [Entomophthora muscae]
MFERFCGSYLDDQGNLQLPIYNVQNSFYKNDRATTGYTCPVGQVCREDENPNGGLTSFDNIKESFIYVFVIGSGQSWYTILYQLAGSTTRASSLYFVIVILTLNFWLLNMFVAVITEVFANLRSSQASAFASSNSLDLFKDNLLPDEGLADFNGTFRRDGAFHHESKSYWVLMKEAVSSRWFDLFWVFMVIANMGLLAIRTSETTKRQEAWLVLWELAFSVLFMAEITLRCIFWSSPGGFLKRGKNQLDSVLAFVNLTVGLLKFFHQHSAYRYLVVFQLLRAYRVVWCIPNVRDLLTKVSGGTTGILNMVFFVFMVIFLCCGIAMQLFGGTLKDEEVVFPNFDSAGWSFLGLYQVFSGEDWSSVLFSTMQGQKESGTVFAAVVFIILFFGLSNFILLNLFVAVLVENLEISEAAKRKIQLEGYFKGIKTNYRRINSYLSPWNVYRYVESDPQHLRIAGLPASLVLPVKEANAKQFLAVSQEGPREAKPKPSVWSRIGKINVRDLMESREEAPPQSAHFANFSGYDMDVDTLFSSVPTTEKEDVFADAHLLARDEFYDAHPSYDKSLFLFSRRSKLRLWCQNLAGSEDHPNFPFVPFTLQWLAYRVFFSFMVIAVVVNVITTLSQTPQRLSDSLASDIFKFTDGIFLVIFSVDVAIHVVADGMLFTPNAYLFSAWNLFYFMALVISYIDYFAAFQQAEGLSRVARAGKAFRVLRLINFSETAKFTLNAVLVSGFWKLFDAASITMCFLIPWAIYLQNVFAGRFYSCNDGDVGTMAECVGEFVDSKLKITMPRQWANPWKYSFDDFPSALRILFEVTSGEGWTDLMKQCMKVTEPGVQPVAFASPFNSILIVTFNFMVSVSILSLFVSIVIDNFTTRSGSALLAVEQRRWKDLSKLLRDIAPPKVRRTPPGNPFIAWLYRLATAKRSWLTRLMAAVHFCILGILASERDNASSIEIMIKVWLGFGLSAICMADMAVRLIGLGPLLFLSNVWNLLQFSLVLFAVVAAFLQTVEPENRMLHNMLNFLLVLVSMRSVALFDGLHQLFKTLRVSAKSIINLLFVWVILFFIYATIFMQVFGMTRTGPNTPDDMANFRDPVDALMMLVRFSQGEGWNSVMYDFTVQPPFCVIDNPTMFLSSDCGSPAWSYALFMSFNILSMYIFLNMFVGVIVDNFSYCYQLDDDDTDDSSTTSDMLSRNQTRSYKQAWAAFDPTRTGYLRPDSLVPFLLSLSPPFDLKIYEPLYSIQTLVDSCFHLIPGSKSVKPHQPIGATDITKVHLNVLNSLLRTMDTNLCHTRRRRLNLIYHECLVFTKPGKGIQFTDALFVLARHKLVDPQSAFGVEELAKYNQIKEQVFYRLNLEKVVSTLRMLLLRRRFLNHMKAKRRESPTAYSLMAPSDLPQRASTSEADSFCESPGFRESQDFMLPFSSPLLIDEDSEEEADQESGAQYLQQLQENPWSRILSQQTGCNPSTSK